MPTPKAVQVRTSTIPDFCAELRRFDYLQELKSLRMEQIDYDEEEEGIERNLDDILRMAALLSEDTEESDELPPPPDIANQPHHPMFRRIEAKRTAKPQKTHVTKWLGDKPKVQASTSTSIMALALSARSGNWKKKIDGQKTRDSIIAVPMDPREFVDPAM